MLSIPRGIRIFVAVEPTDMRKGIDGLGALVRKYGEDVFGGHLYVFLSRRRDRLKILAWDNGGFVVYYKRLEKGRFPPIIGEAGEATVQIDAADLHLLLDAVDFRHLKRPKLWGPPKKNIA